MLRCQISSNPCGTDTWDKDYKCPCDSCQEYLDMDDFDRAIYQSAVDGSLDAALKEMDLESDLVRL